MRAYAKDSRSVAGRDHINDVVAAYSKPKISECLRRDRGVCVAGRLELIYGEGLVVAKRIQFGSPTKKSTTVY